MAILGCNTQLFVGHSLDEILPLIVEAGYETIDLFSQPVVPLNDPFIQLGRPSSYYTDLKRKISLFGLNVGSLSGSFGIEIGSPEFDRVVEVCHMMGLPAIAIESAGLSDNDEAFSWMLNAVNRSSLLAAQAEIKIMIKPYFGKSVYSLETTTKFTQSVDPAWVGINFDASQLWFAEPELDPIESLDRLKDFVCCFNLRDCRRGQIPTLDDQQIPGQGDIEFESLAEFASDISNISMAMLDLHSTPHRSLDDLRKWLDQSIQYLQPIFDQS